MTKPKKKKRAAQSARRPAANDYGATSQEGGENASLLTGDDSIGQLASEQESHAELEVGMTKPKKKKRAAQSARRLVLLHSESCYG
jgi:peptide subunit release factor 1 (eRF1)